MNKYNPKIHKRRSIRLKGYDYSQAGLYFVTMCVQNRDRLFGSIHNGKLKNNDAGKMIEKWYFELENKFPNVHCGEHIIMPDHFHCIIHIVRPVGVRADLCTCQCVRAGLCACPPNEPISGEHNKIPISGEHTGSPLSAMVQWFKTMTTNEYIRNVKSNNWQRFNGKLWQRNYWEHIIRNEKSHKNISRYIINNPSKWNMTH